MSHMVTLGAASVVLQPPQFFNNPDPSIQPVWYRPTVPGSIRGRMQDADLLWPRSRVVGTQVTTYNNAETIWERPGLYASWGHSGRKYIEGITRDGAGVALGACTVQLFNTSTGLLVDTGTSDAGGYYRLGDPNNVACFVVAYKIGTPVMGTTINTLTGT